MKLDRLLDARERLIAIPVAPLILLAGILAVNHAGFGETEWYPAALFTLGVLVAALVAARPGGRDVNRLVLVALALYALFCAWTYLSIIWATVPGRAWDGANRNAFYGIVFAIVVLRPWPRRLLRILLWAVGGLLALIALGILVDTAIRDDLSPLFVEGRLSLPAGYANATANLLLIGWFPLIALVVRPAGAVWSRVLAGAAATLLLSVALLPQSRGGLAAVVLVALAFVALIPARWPALMAMAASVTGTAIASGAIFDVRNAASAAELGDAMGDARVSILIGCLVTAVLVAFGLLAGRQARERKLTGPSLRRQGDRALVGLAVLGLVAVLVAIGNPVSFAQDRWDDFKTDSYDELALQENRFTGSLGSERYDFYRVALDDFTDRPVLGVGADSFGPSYLVDGRSLQQPRYAHSLALAALAETGLVGTLLLFGFLAVIGFLAAQSILRARGIDRVLVLGALAGSLVFLVHAMADWLWQFPALVILALVLCGAAIRAGEPLRRPGETSPLEAPLEEPEPRRSRRPVELVAVVAGAVVAIALAFSFALPGIAARFVDSAYEVAAGDPARAAHRLDRAASFNRLTADPLLTMAILDRRSGKLRSAVGALERAIEREPKNWFAQMELGLTYLQGGDRRRGLEALNAALALNPRQIVLIDAVRNVRAGEDLDPNRIEEVLNRQTESRLAATEAATQR